MSVVAVIVIAVVKGVVLQIHLGDCVGHSDLSTGQFCHFIAKVLHFIASCIIPYNLVMRMIVILWMLLEMKVSVTYDDDEARFMWL